MCPLELREATWRVWCFSFGTSRLILVHQPKGVSKMYHPSSFLWLLATSPSCATRSSRKHTQPPKHSYDERMKRGRLIRTALSVFCVSLFRRFAWCVIHRAPGSPGTQQDVFFNCDRLCVYVRKTTHMNRKTTSAPRA